MKNFIQPGDVVSVTAPADVASGVGVKVGVLFGIAVRDAASGTPIDIQTSGVVEIAKTSAQAWTEGVAIYWNDTQKVATTASTAGNLLIGAAVAAAANPSPTGTVRLNGAAPAAVTA